MAAPTIATRATTSSPATHRLSVQAFPIWPHPLEADICIEDETRRFHLKFDKVQLDDETLDELKDEQMMPDYWLRKYYLEDLLTNEQLLEFDGWLRNVYAANE